jgi:YidC/Oxa1 family membrane protein insertase
MDKKGIFMIFICVALWMFMDPILDKFFPSSPQKAVPGSSTNAISQAAGSQTTTVVGTNGTTTVPAPAVVSTTSEVFPKTIPAATETKVLENNDFRLELSNVGGGIRKIDLKKFTKRKTSDLIVLNHQGVIPVFDASIGDVSFGATYQLVPSAVDLQAQYQSPSGIQIAKTYQLKGDYLIDAQLVLKNVGNLPVESTLQVCLGTASAVDDDTVDQIGFSHYSKEHDGTHLKVPALKKHIEKQQKYSQDGPIDWAAVKSQYFTILTTPKKPFAGITANVVQPPASSEKAPTEGVVASIYTPISLAPGQSTNLTFSIYAGPNEYERLSNLGRGQDENLELSGFTGPFSKGLIWLMSKFFALFHNWGVAIICVTILIKIIFWPLTAMSTKSMKQMQALAPQMNLLKEKHKDNPQKMNEEMMKMYREYKINPLMGCLPMLVQIPIFFAFYHLLTVAVELRGAPFIGWMHDLSAPDTVAFIPILDYPINPLPLIMAVTMIWQTRITPQPPNADPSMKIMMWLMPVIFLVFCYNFSSGLSLYWTAQNLLTILQTYMTRNTPVEPPQKQKAPKAGGGGFTFMRPNQK